VRVLASAEAFGYGPASKLHAICSEISGNGGLAHMVGQGVALTFAASNREAFASITAVADAADLARIPPDGFDVALSVMDPVLVAWAAYHHLPCVYVDSLSWFWDWSDVQDDKAEIVAGSIIRAASVFEALQRMTELPMHLSQYLAHRLCTLACVQRAPGASAETALVRAGQNALMIEAIVDLKHRETAEPDVWLASTSGLLSPLVSPDLAAMWIGSACELIETAARANGHEEQIMLVGNPDALHHAASRIPPRFMTVPLSHIEMLRWLNRAIACLTPPGLTTILESAAYGAPVVFLPEEHYGHLANYRLVTGTSPVPHYSGALLNTHLDRGVDLDMDAETTSLIVQLDVHRVRQSDAWSAMVNSMADAMAEAKGDRVGTAAKQAGLVKGLVGGYAGAAQVYWALKSIVDRTA
jgi:hypothetical protein